MKYVIVRCEDLARAGEETVSLLAGAKTAHLQQLSQAGAAGLIRSDKRRRAVDRFQVHRGLLGVAPHDPQASPGAWYAASARVACGEGETAWCCELVTQHEGRIMDSTAGNIPTKESRELIQTLNSELGSEHRRWEVGDASHHVFITRDRALDVGGAFGPDSPELVVGRLWKRSLPKGPEGQALRPLIEQASKLLEGHAINRVRVDLGENPANLVWLWGAARSAQGTPPANRTGRSRAIVSHSFPMRGLAACLGLTWEAGPATLKEESLQRLMKSLPSLIQRHDLVYVHVQVEQGDPVERLCTMERLDQLLLKPLTKMLSDGRLLVAIDDRHGAVPFVAIGPGLPQQPVARLQAESFAESPLQFDDGSTLFAWFTVQ